MPEDRGQKIAQPWRRFAEVAAMQRFCFCLVGVSACQSPLGASIEAFEDARYPDAITHLRCTDANDLSEHERAQYHLYAGLSHLSLGNQRGAVVHLSRARSLLERKPELFSRDEQARLFRAWQSLGRFPGEPLNP